MTVRIYRSTDASAPVLTGQVDKLTAVLDAVLVNGYGSTTAAGWTIAYTTTNKRQYAMAAGGTSCQLFVDDSGPGAGAAKEARINGFKTGTGLGTGTGQFPTTSQMTAPSGALVVRKSTTADATARAWTIIADGHTLYMFIETGDQTAPVMAYPWMFGDFFSYSSTDTSNCIIIGRTTENTANAGTNSSYTQSTTAYIDPFAGLANMNSTGLSNTLSGHYVCANFTNTGGSIAVGKHSDQAKMGGMGVSTNTTAMQTGYLGTWTTGTSNSGSTWPNTFNYPNGPDGGLYVAPLWIHHNGMVRGYLKGLWCPLQHVPMGHADTYSGTGNLSGKSLISQNILGLFQVATGSQTATPCQVHVEYSDTWS